MAGTPIYPFDNDRLKTAKVIAALRGNSQLPEKRADWPNALECRQAFVEKIAKATGVAPIKPSADRPFAAALNAALGISSGGGSGGNGGGGSYTAQAVHFDGSTWLISSDLLGVVPSSKGICSFWCKQAVQNDLSAASNGNLISTPNNFTVTLAGIPSNTQTGDYNTIGFFGIDGNFSAPINDLNTDAEDNGVPVGTWTHILIAWDSAFATPNKRIALYVNDVSKPWTNVYEDSGTSFETLYEDHWTVGTYPGAPGPGILGDIADLYLNTDETIVETGATISLVNRRKFISGSGKPVSLGANGSVPTGTAPKIFLTGNAAAFAANAGSGGGAFTPTGTLTNATTSPSD